MKCNSSQELKSIRQCIYCHNFCRFSCPSYEATRDQKILQNQKNYLLYLGKKKVINLDNYTGKSFYLCNDCKRCEQFCWDDDKDVLPINRSAREFAIENNIAPEEIKKLYSNLKEHKNMFGGDFQNKVKEKLAPFAKRKKAGKKDTNNYIYLGDFTRKFGIESFLDFLKILDASDIDYVFDLCEIPDGTLALDMGMRKLGLNLMKECHKKISEFDPGKIIVMDPESYYGLKVEYSRQGLKLGCEVVHYTAVIENIIERIKVSKFKGQLRYFDPCKLGRYMHEYEAPRKILKKLFGLENIDFFQSREESFCCGGYISLFDLDRVADISEKVISDCLADDCRTIITACSLCMFNLRNTSEGTGIKIYDLPTFIVKNIQK